MLTKDQIKDAFFSLNEKLAKRGEIGEVGIVGGAVMCLVFDARKSTRDVDAIFKPPALMRKMIAEVAEDFDFEKDWLNDAAKGFIQGNFKQVDVLNLSHLRVWAPEPKYMLAMKCLSARWDTLDRKDVMFLVENLKLRKKDEVFKIIENFFPKNKIPAKTQFFIEELFE